MTNPAHPDPAHLAAELRRCDAEIPALLVEAREFAGAVPVQCEGLTARWCPRCGTCVCPEDGDLDLDSDDCPLHSSTSDHAEPDVGLDLVDMVLDTCDPAATCGIGNDEIAAVRLRFIKMTTLIGHLADTLERLVLERDEAEMRDRKRREETELLKEQVATLQGDRCDVCDEDGLIYADDGSSEFGAEKAQTCPVCDGTRSGTTSRVIKERDEAAREAERLRALLSEAAPHVAIEFMPSGEFEARWPQQQAEYVHDEDGWKLRASDLLARIDLARTGKDGTK